VGHVNINSLRNKTQEISQLLHDNNFHVLAISETHLDDSVLDGALHVGDYTVLRKDRNNRGGGVALFINSNIPHKRRADLEINGIELLWTEIHLPYVQPILIGCLYRPPSAKAEYLNTIVQSLETVSNGDKEVMILGDFNIDWSSDTCTMKQRLNLELSSLNLTQMVKDPTRICTNVNGTETSSCIDLLFTNRPDLFTCAKSSPLGCTDHNLVYITRKTKPPKGQPTITHKRSYKKFNQLKFLQDISEVPWHLVSNEQDVNDALHCFMTLFTQVVDEHAPVRKSTVRSSPAQWVDGDLRELMTLRDDAKKEAQASGLSSDYMVYKRLRNVVVRENRKKKKAHYRELLDTHSCNGDTKKLWRVINGILGRNTCDTPKFIETNGKILTKPKDIADHFNEYFVNKVLRLTQGDEPDITRITAPIDKYIMKSNECSFSFQRVTVHYVHELLTYLPQCYSTGFDNIDNTLLRISADHIATPLCHIFNSSIEQEIFPTQWKSAKVLPLIKNKALPLNGPNSRPISLLPAISKLMEKICKDQIQSYLVSNNILSDRQHAYKMHHSTASALVQMTDRWREEVDKGNLVGAVLLDFSAAFDVVNHKVLLAKLKSYGFVQSAVNWVNSYLTDRTQAVSVNGGVSSHRKCLSGVPQGSCLGPLLFCIYTNDLPTAITHCNIELYADDSTPSASGPNVSMIQNTLQAELNHIWDWVQANKLVLNVEKTKSILMGSRHRLRSNPELQLSLNGKRIEQVFQAKLLGFIIDQYLTWTQQADKVLNRMTGSLAMLKRSRHLIVDGPLKMVTQALVLSHLDYCACLLSACPQTSLNKLQILQNRAARLILNARYNENIDYMHSKLQWPTVKERLYTGTLSMFNKLLVSKEPRAMYSRLENISSRHEHSTRLATSGGFRLPKPRTAALTRTFLYRCTKSYNTFPPQMKATSPSIFKTHIVNWIRTKINTNKPLQDWW